MLNSKFQGKKTPQNRKISGVCNGIVFPCTHTEEYYVCTYCQMVYLRDQMTRTPSLSNPPIGTTPPGTPKKEPLGIFTPKYDSSWHQKGNNF